MDEDNENNKAALELEKTIKEKGYLYPYKLLFSEPKVIIFCIISAIAGIGRYGLLTWIPTYFTEELGLTIKDGIFREIPPEVVDNVDQSAIAEDIDDISSHKNDTVVDIFDDFEDDELDEIANEYSLSNGPKSKLRKKKSSEDDSDKDKKEEKLDKGQTTLFSF